MIMLMNLERRITRRRIILGAGAVFGTVFVGPPLLHIENTLRVFGAVLGNEVDCAEGKEPKEKSYPFDAIVVPGAGSVLTSQGSFPNDYGKLRLEAAALAYLQKMAPRIILLDGTKSPQEDEHVNEKYLKDAFRNITGSELPQEAIIRENRSINTATNMQELSKITKEQNIVKVLIITNDFHKTRATLFACYNNVAASSISAEELIIDADPNRRQEIHTLYHTREVGEMENKELYKTILSLWDPNGTVSTFLKKLQTR